MKNKHTLKKMVVNCDLHGDVEMDVTMGEYGSYITANGGEGEFHTWANSTLVFHCPLCKTMGVEITLCDFF